MLSNHLLKAIAVVVGLTSLQANASLIQNGSFDQSFNAMSKPSLFQDPRSFDSLANAATDAGYRWGIYDYLPSWKMLYNAAAGIEVNASGVQTLVNGVTTTFNAQDGKYFVELDTHTDLILGTGQVVNATNVGIYQDLTNLTIGKEYELTFWYRARNTNANDNLLDLYWLKTNDVLNYAGQKTATVDFNAAVVVGNQVVNNHENWVQYKFNLTASATEMSLGFGGSGSKPFSYTDPNGLTYTSFDGSKQGALLDNVSLTEKVPEPATLAMFGLAAAGLLARRRKA